MLQQMRRLGTLPDTAQMLVEEERQQQQSLAQWLKLQLAVEVRVTQKE
jgi:hypothetical protein